MADVFISYAREDETCAGALAEALTQVGYTVWWDRRLAAGADLSEAIEAEIEAAASVLVLWSTVSRKSHWVLDEATEARDTGKYIPLTIEEGVRPPLGFRSVHAADLGAWREMGFEVIKAALLERLGEPKSGSTGGVAAHTEAAHDTEESSAGVEPIPSAGEGHTDEKTGLSFVWIPPGEFVMGSKEAGYDNERPVRKVRLTRGFWLGRYPVTDRDYARFLESTPNPEYWDDREFDRESHPVCGVSWKEAQNYCDWAGCRLPTEAEWEYACRAETTTSFNFRGGEKKLRGHGWFTKNSKGSTQPVGLKPANAWGLHDMHGNVWEWCQDWYDAGYYGSRPNLHEDPQGPASGEFRVLRGGSWFDVAERCRSAYRSGWDPGCRSGDIGFRVVLSPPLRSVPL